ncbi:flavohemoglobin expression-modulating QEGLA motif protein [Dokdonella soli]|uniref:Flavohemoglobin expression-modulating QEGLA motif protein n=1 Tax=Dokdonella soli TaxID=529810 RepID=A0ABN1J013_9GAMM
MPVAESADHNAELDQRLVAATRGIGLLASVSWPASAELEFIAAWKAGNASLPQITYPACDYAATREALDGIAGAADPAHPLGDYIRRTAESWRIATELLEAMGTSGITEHSAKLYGRPDDRVPGATLTNLDAAHHFIAIADEYNSGAPLDEIEAEIPAESLQGELQQKLDAFFGAAVVKVETDPDLIAKAAAGATRIRLRSATNFSDYDRDQLLAHEAFVHSLTALNGRAQPHLKSLARSSPRITATQEGLAVFAELMSGSIDISRMKRISLRILGIDMAIRGADFIDVFRFFMDSGQNEADSFASAQRVFRGAPVTGGAAFTKDAVYLHGLLSVHTFFRWALKNQRMALCRNLFAGKLALHDVIALEPYFDNGYIAQPRYLPPWVQHAHGLAGILAFSLFANRIRLDRVEAEDLVLGL